MTPPALPLPPRNPLSLRAADEGVLPVGTDGKPLNLDFETGTLKDWTAEGDAFKDQPIKGDTVIRRRGDMKSRHQGQYWIGGYEKLRRQADRARSPACRSRSRTRGPASSSAAGRTPDTCVELVLRGHGKVFYRACGLEEEDLRRVVVDLTTHMGKEIFIRLVDKHTGHWGHVNFDDFRFHAEKPDVPAAAEGDAAAAADDYKYAGLPPKKAAAAMTVPEGFTVTLFAGEPDVISRSPSASTTAAGCGSPRRTSTRALPSRAAAARGRAQEGRPHPDLRGHRRRRQVRQDAPCSWRG